MSNSLTVYTTGPACVKCTLTKKALDKAGVSYTEVNLTLPDNADLAERFRAEGRGSAPVVVDELRDHTWSDFRPDEVKASAAARSPELVAV